MIARLILATAIAALFPPIAGVMAQERSFACEGGSGGQREMTERASNAGMMRILGFYRDRYDAIYVRQQCEAFADGQPYTITCLDDVRDWDAIEATIPDDYFGMSTRDLAPFLSEERKRGRDILNAYEYCREVGAIK